MTLIPANANIVPATSKSVLQTNYLTDFDFKNQYLPDVYEQKFHVSEIEQSLDF